jgi:predicted NAD/FAD-dependent oxidoreductase
VADWTGDVGDGRYHESMSGALEGHQRIDQRSLALHRAIAKKLHTNPALLEIARSNLDRWSVANSRSQPYWDAWREILTRPLPDILALLVEDSERMTALRQATPFAGVLEPAERWAIYASFESSRSRSL